MYRVYATSQLTGGKLRAAMALGLPITNCEPIGWSRPGPKWKHDGGRNSIAAGNRRTGEAHEHRREIARRLGQAAAR